MIIGNLIWQLQEDGLLNINDPIGDYIPEIAAAITNGDRITIKMLLNHTSGIYQIGRDLDFNLGVVGMILLDIGPLMILYNILRINQLRMNLERNKITVTQIP